MNYIDFEMGLRMFAIGISLFAIISTILFIWDGIHAKREGTGRKTYIIAMFVSSMSIIAVMVVGWILLYILGTLFMRSM